MKQDFYVLIDARRCDHAVPSFYFISIDIENLDLWLA